MVSLNLKRIKNETPTTCAVNTWTYYPSYQDGIEVRCKYGRPKHLVEISKSGRGLKLEGHGDDQYSWPITYLFPEASDEKCKS